MFRSAWMTGKLALRSTKSEGEDVKSNEGGEHEISLVNKASD